MRRQLNQLRPSDTSTTTAYSNAVNPWTVEVILVSNVTSSATTFSIYHDSDGTTYTADTALYFNVAIEGQDTAYIEFPGGLANADRRGSIGCKSGAGSGCTFTLYGQVAGERL